LWPAQSGGDDVCVREQSSAVKRSVTVWAKKRWCVVAVLQVYKAGVVGEIRIAGAGFAWRRHTLGKVSSLKRP
jgi:hypothetical protein